jgi:glycosyltransferase involved in cell wall biosynthesis
MNSREGAGVGPQEPYPPETREERKRSFRAGDGARLAAIRRSARYELSFREPEPLISVIISTYDRAELLLERALPSMLAQDYERWELLVIGDGMDEGQARLLRGIPDRRVFFHNLRTRGVYPRGYVRWNVLGSKPANFGLRVARGRWVSHLDDDDAYTPAHMSRLLGMARERRVEWVHGKVLLRPLDAEGEVCIGSALPAQGRIAQASTLYHAALKTFRYNPECWRYDYPGDWDLWERFLEAGVTHAHLPEVVGYHYNERPAMRQRLRELNADQCP